MPNPITKWIREVRLGTDAQPDPERVFRQRVEAWVEFKRLHLAFAQTLNSLINGHSSLLALIKHAMLCEQEVRDMTALAGAAPDEALSLDNVLRRLPLATYCRLYRLVNNRAFDDAALQSLIDPRDFKIAETILRVVSGKLGPSDALFERLAREHGFQTDGRAARWTPEITALHADIVQYYKTSLRAKGLL